MEKSEGSRNLFQDKSTSTLKMSRKESFLINENDDLRNTINELNKAIAAQKNEIDSIRKEKDSYKAKYETQLKQISELQSRVHTEESKKEADDDNKKTHDEILSKFTEELQNRKNVEFKNITLQDLVNEKQEEIKKLENTIAELNNKYNNQSLTVAKLQSELEEKTKKISDLQLSSSLLKKENNFLSNKNAITSSKTNLDTQRLIERENQIDLLNAQLQHYEKDIFELKSTLMVRTKELKEAQEEKQQIETETKNMLYEMGVINEQEKSQSEVSTSRSQIKNTIQNLTVSLQRASLQNEKLNQNLHMFVNENKEAAKHIKGLEKRVEGDNIKILELNKENQSLCNQIEQLVNENVKLKGYVNEAEHEKDLSENYRRCIVTLKNEIVELNNEVDVLNRKITSLLKDNEKKKNYNNLLSNYESMLQIERSRNKNATNVLKALKSQMNILREENEKLKRDNIRVGGNICNTILKTDQTTSQEDNVYLRSFINNLQNQIESLTYELKQVKDDKVKI